MRPFRWPGRALPALLTAVALAGGAGPAASKWPTLDLNAGLLGVPQPRAQVVPARSVPDQNYFFPAYLEARLAPSPKVPVSQVARTEFLQDAGVVVRVYSVAALLATEASGYGPASRHQIETLWAINAGRLDPARLIPPGGSTSSAPTLPYLNDPSFFQWAAGGLRRLTLPDGVRGLRYLVVRAGDTGMWPAEAAQYAFQGLSADGRHYLTLTAPYAPAGVLGMTELERRFPEWRTAPGGNDAFDAYARQYGRRLDANTEAPTVRLLDQLVLSLRLR